MLFNRWLNSRTGRNKMTLEAPNNVDGRNIPEFWYSILMLTISFLSVVSDIFMGLALIIQYYSTGYIAWAIITFSFIFFPSVIMQIVSIKVYPSDRNVLPSQWLLHCLLVGIIHRYIIAIRKCVKSYKSKNSMESNLVKTELLILKNLHLFNTFLECAPQLVFQLYFVAVAPISLPLTGAAAAASAFSVAWALMIHTKMKKGKDCPGLLFLVLWRVGMITARISALVLCVYTCGPWMILFIGSHWLAMTLWVTYQRAALDDKDKKKEFYSALFGVIYCFCFVTLKTGSSRSNAIILNSLLLFQNLIFLAVFLLSFSDKSPRLAVVSFITVTFGSLLGVISFFIYNTFFHPSGPFKCVTSSQGSRCCAREKGLFGKQNNFLIKKLEKTPENSCSRPENEQLRGIQSSSDSIIVIEESETPNSKADEKILKNEESEHIYDEPNPGEVKNQSEEVKLSAALKRRAICSSVDLTRFLDGKIEDDSESNKSSRAVAPEETASEILSTHDYENLCAVNIAREPWGIRSWRVYSDIETYRHDDSVFNERRLDNTTTSSEYSGKIGDKDSLNIADDDLLQCETDTNSDKTSVNFVPPFPTSMLHTIFEEHESPSGCISAGGGKCNSESALVATIDKICTYTPLRSRSGSISDPAEGRRMPEDKFLDGSSVKKGLQMESDGFSPLNGKKNRSVDKFNIFKGRYETNRYQVCGKTASGVSGGKNIDETNKENVSMESREAAERNGTKKRFNFKEKSSSLVQMLTPSKLERRTFPISPHKRCQR